MIDPSAYEYDDDDDPPEFAGWVDWPQCPICGSRRQARCPTCAFPGADFPLADYQEVGWQPLARQADFSWGDREGDAAVLLLCPSCDEAFRPHFYDRCAACGYEYDDGVRLEDPDRENLSPRILWAGAGVVAAMAALLIYFWAILHW